MRLHMPVRRVRRRASVLDRDCGASRRRRRPTSTECMTRAEALRTFVETERFALRELRGQRRASAATVLRPGVVQVPHYRAIILQSFRTRLPIPLQSAPRCLVTSDVRAAFTRAHALLRCRRAGVLTAGLLCIVGISLAYAFGLNRQEHASIVPAPFDEPAAPTGAHGDDRAASSPEVAGAVSGADRVEPQVGVDASTHGPRSMPKAQSGHRRRSAAAALPGDRSTATDVMNTSQTTEGSDGGGRALEHPEAVHADVLDIRNVGDRIVVSRVPGGRPIDTTGWYAEARNPPSDRVAAGSGAGSSARTDDRAGDDDDAGASNPRPDYEDVYPGCPRTLPPGADAQMAAERQALYGCVYFESCELPSDENNPICTWHLMQKL